MTLFYECEKQQCLPQRPLVLPSVVPSDQLLFAEPTSLTRRKKGDVWRNSGGKNAVVVTKVPLDLIFGKHNAGLFVSKRTGKIKRLGHVDLTYHQFNIGASFGEEFKPGPRSGKVTLYHIVPASAKSSGRRTARQKAADAEQPAAEQPAARAEGGVDHDDGPRVRTNSGQSRSSGRRKRRGGDSSGRPRRSRPQTKSKSATGASRDSASRELENGASLLGAGAENRREELAQRDASGRPVLDFDHLAGVGKIEDGGHRIFMNGDHVGKLHADAGTEPRKRRRTVRQIFQNTELIALSGVLGVVACVALALSAGSNGSEGSGELPVESNAIHCPNGYWSDGVGPCQACTDCEQQFGSFAVQSCSQTEDTKCSFYWKEMENSHPEVNQSADGVSSTWHLPRDFVTWSDGASLFAFGGAASSLPEDTTTTTTCLPPAAANLLSGHRRALQFERHDQFPAGMAVGEAQLTNELWQLQLTQTSEQASPVTVKFGSKGSWQLIGGGPSREVDEFFHSKLKYGYFGPNHGRGLSGSSTWDTDDPVTEEDFDDGVVGSLQPGARSDWPRARFGASAWGGTALAPRTPASMTDGFTGVMFSGMMSRPCFSSETMAEQRASGLGQDMFLMPNDLWGFSADTMNFTYVGGEQHWIWRESLVDVLADFSAGKGAFTHSINYKQIRRVCLSFCC